MNKFFLPAFFALIYGWGSEGYTDQTWTYTYSDTGQLLVEDGPQTGSVDTGTYSYDAHGNLASYTNALGHVISYNAYDSSGRLLSVTDANGVATEFAYGARGRLSASTVRPPLSG